MNLNRELQPIGMPEALTEADRVARPPSSLALEVQLPRSWDPVLRQYSDRRANHHGDVRFTAGAKPVLPSDNLDDLIAQRGTQNCRSSPGERIVGTPMEASHFILI